jgi:hypothetical protein
MNNTFLKYIKLTLAFILFLQVGQVSAQTITATGGGAYTLNSGIMAYPCGDVTGATSGGSSLQNNTSAITLTSDVFVTSMSFLVASMDVGETHRFDAQGITNEVLSVPSSCTGLYTISGNTLAPSINTGNITRVTVSSVTPFKEVVITKVTGTAFIFVSGSTQSTPCYAGNTAPTLSATTLTAACPANTVNLNSLVTSTLPTGGTLKWYTSTARTTEVIDPTGVTTSGTYYAFYYDATNNCFSGASAAVTATYTVCPLNLTTVCPAVSVDLASRVTDTAPSGYTYTYHSGTPATTANRLSSSIVSTGGTYYIASYFAGQDCYTNTSRPMVVTITNCCTTVAPPKVN